MIETEIKDLGRNIIHVVKISKGEASGPRCISRSRLLKTECKNSGVLELVCTCSQAVIAEFLGLLKAGC